MDSIVPPLLCPLRKEHLWFLGKTRPNWIGTSLIYQSVERVGEDFTFASGHFPSEDLVARIASFLTHRCVPCLVFANGHAPLHTSGSGDCKPNPRQSRYGDRLDVPVLHIPYRLALNLHTLVYCTNPMLTSSRPNWLRRIIFSLYLSNL